MTPEMQGLLFIFGILFAVFLLGMLCYEKSCQHDMIYRGYTSHLDEYRNMMYSKRKYQCTKCGEIVWIDTRYGDPYFPKAWKH